MTHSPESRDLQKEAEEIEAAFPALRGGTGYTNESRKTIVYNCLSWALGIDWTNYNPEPRCAGYYWFPGIDREWSVRTITQVVEKHSYQLCHDYELEEGYEKIVFYIDHSGSPEHFARQLSDGRWTSKLGKLNDINHDSLDSLAIPAYGKPQLVFKRKREQKQGA